MQNNHDQNEPTKNLSYAINKNIGKQIRYLRVRENLTQSDLAAHLNISYQQIQKYEKGSSQISAVRLVLIAQFFDVSLDYFIQNTLLMKPDDNIRSLNSALSSLNNYKIQNSIIDLINTVKRSPTLNNKNQ